MRKSKQEITESAGAEPTTPPTPQMPPRQTPHASGAAASIEEMAREAAMRGEDVFDDVL